MLVTTPSVFQDKAPFLNLSVVPWFGRERSSQQWWRRSMGDYFCVWLGTLKLLGLHGICSRLLREQPTVTVRLPCIICEELWQGKVPVYLNKINLLLLINSKVRESVGSCTLISTSVPGRVKECICLEPTYKQVKNKRKPQHVFQEQTVLD